MQRIVSQASPDEEIGTNAVLPLFEPRRVDYPSSPSKDFAACKSLVSKPSVNQS
jgi:hypothetical protein